MPLNIELKPSEKVFINGAVIANGGDRAHLTLLNDAAVLREKDIMTVAMADSPCKRVYFTIQLMYMDPRNAPVFMPDFAKLCQEIADAAPSTLGMFAGIQEELADGNLYAALKLARKLIDYEQELLSHASQSA